MELLEIAPENHRSGYVAIVGRPNAGKSTLINRLVSYKVSIVSNRPQTTRNRIAGIRSDETSQIIFVDTPGVHQSDLALNQFMMEQVRSALEDVDLILYIKDGLSKSRDDDTTLEMIASANTPSVAAINKIDRIKKARLLPTLQELGALGKFEEIVPISALTGDGVDALVSTTVAHLPLGPRFFPVDQVSDVTQRFIAAEIIREKIFHLLQQELPYSSAVEIEDYQELTSKDLVRIHACIHVERDSQKGIVIGKKGAMLRRIGTEARAELQSLLGCSVYLKLFVKVDRDWTKNPRVVRRLGHAPS